MFRRPEMAEKTENMDQGKAGQEKNIYKEPGKELLGISKNPNYSEP